MTLVENFRQAMAFLASAVYVITGVDEMGRPRGFTATSVLLVSQDPLRIAVSIDRSSFSHDALAGGDAFGLNVLAPEQASTANLFASKRADKFDRVAWRWEQGTPVIGDTALSTVCSVESATTHGDHTFLIGAPAHDPLPRREHPLLYWGREYHELPPGPFSETTKTRREDLMTTDRRSTEATRLQERISGLVPAVRDRARETESLRQLPEETIADLTDASIFRMFRPERFGGIEVEWGTQMEAARTLASVCGSTGWIVAVVSTHSAMVGRFSGEAQEEVWDTDDDVLIATGSARTEGKAVPVDGGYMVDGAWRFASGIDYSHWVIVPAPVEGMEGRGPEILSQCLIPASEYQITDDWHVSGLGGTGSKRVDVPEPVFVPTHRTIPFLDLQAANPPGAEVNDHYVYRMEFGPYFGTILLGPVLGAAEGALNEYLESTRSRVGAIMGNRVAESVPVQLRVAESAAQISAAGRAFDAILETLVRRARAGALLTPRERVESMRDRAWIARQCVDAVHRLIRQMGATGLSDSNPVQRQFRDLSAMSAQIGLNWDRNASTYGKWALGVATGDKAIDGDVPVSQENVSDSVA